MVGAVLSVGCASGEMACVGAAGDAPSARLYGGWGRVRMAVWWVWSGMAMVTAR